MAIRRWVAILDSWAADGILLVQALQSKESFTEKAQILVDVFFNKAPQTLMKRVNSISKVCGQLASQGIGFPCAESEFYDFLKAEAQKGAPALSKNHMTPPQRKENQCPALQVVHKPSKCC
jgi:hypothetical protein